MTGALRALLAGILDYAGLFPPAGLSMGEAAASYARHRNGPHAFLLARFVTPASRLVELEEATASLAIPSNAPWDLAVLSQAMEAERPDQALAQDLAALTAFLERNPQGHRPVALEIRLPSALLVSPPTSLGPDLLKRLHQRVLASPGAPRTLFYEIGMGPAWEKTLPAWMDAVAVAARAASALTVGVKIRTGGLEASAFPPPAQIAAFVLAARRRELPMKATAGLHHPLRRYFPEVGTKMYGFLNVFGGAVLAWAGKLDQESLIRILEDEDPAHFRFDDTGFAWKGHQVSVETIAQARDRFALSFGSCSFTEPVGDLEALGLL